MTSGQLMETTTKRHEVPGKKPKKAKDPERRIRDTVEFTTGVAGTVATFFTGFNILPVSTLPEKVLTFFTAVSLSGAIIFGTGAWRSVRRFRRMAISAGLAFTCLAALSVVARQAAAGPRAQGNVSLLSPASSRPASGTPTGSPSTAGTASDMSGQGATGQGLASASSDYALEYAKKQFTIPGGGCQDFDYESYALFTGQGPVVNLYSGFDPPADPWGLILNCLSSDIEFNGKIATISGNPNPDPNACATAIDRHPLAEGIPFSQLTSGTEVCMKTNDGTELILVTLLSASGSSFDTTWSGTVWSLPANN